MALVAFFLVLGATLASLVGGSGRHCARVLVVSIVGVVVSGAASASVSRLDAPAACSRSTSAYWCAAELSPSSTQFSAANQAQVALPPRMAAASRLFAGQFENCQTVRFTDPFTRSYDAHPLLRVAHFGMATNTPRPGVSAPEPVVKPSGVPDRSSAVYVNVEMADGTIRTVGSETGSLVHAEDAAQALSPGGRMSQPYGWRMGPNGKVTWQPIDVCATCQAKYPPTMFPPGTGGAPGGSWTSK